MAIRFPAAGCRLPAAGTGRVFASPWYHRMLALPRMAGMWECKSMNVATYRDALMQKRAELIQTAGLRPLQTSMEHNNGRQGDMADQAAGNNEVHIQLRLKQTDAKILQAIDEALLRIDKGTFGICRDCGEPIAEARLNAIPWTRVCITCKEKQKA
jgi:DnaK suppressor protein